MKCTQCNNNAQYLSPITGQPVCLQHARLWVEAAATSLPPGQRLPIRAATLVDRPRIAWLADYFWGETRVDCFGRTYDVLQLPAFVACAGREDGTIVGMLVYAAEPDRGAVNVVMLNVLPGYQGRGAGRALLDAVRAEARQLGMAQLIVATSNDDLPALAFYQRYGFVIIGISPQAILKHHGEEIAGFSGIPVRDEIQLALELAAA